MRLKLYSSGYAALLLALLLLLAGCGGAATVKEEAVDSVAPTSSESKANEYFTQGLQALNSGDLVKAKGFFVAMSRLYSDYSGPYANLGLLHKKEGDPDAARRAFEYALSLNKGDPELYNQLAMLQRSQGEFKSALQNYQMGLEVDETYPNLHLNLGILYDLYMGDAEKALQHYQRYQALSPSKDREVELWITDLKRRIGS